MQTVRIATSLQNTTRLLIDDLHFVVDYYILHILLEHAVCLEQLVDGVNTLRTDGVIVQDGILLGCFLLCRDILFFNVSDARTDVWQHKEAIFTNAF